MQRIQSGLGTRWGVIGGRLVDTFDDAFDRSPIGGAFVGGGSVGVGIGAGVGVHHDHHGHGHPGSVSSLYPCRQTVCSLQQIYPPRCAYTPVLRSSLTGRHCLGCPQDICRGSGINIIGGGAGIGIGGGAGIGGRRPRRRLRRIRRIACRLLGICDYPGQHIGGLGVVGGGAVGVAGGVGGIGLIG